MVKKATVEATLKGQTYTLDGAAVDKLGVVAKTILIAGKSAAEAVRKAIALVRDDVMTDAEAVALAQSLMCKMVVDDTAKDTIRSAVSRYRRANGIPSLNPGKASKVAKSALAKAKATAEALSASDRAKLSAWLIWRSRQA